MNKQSLWIVVVVTAAWIGFMLGYSMSAQTGAKSAIAAPAAASGGYGDSARPAAGGYGGSARPAAGGYGGSAQPAAAGKGR